ncbi:MAG TPA: MobQ family relaxase [Rhizomicrobium sp.]
MANYYLQVKMISRRKGDSAIAAAAYCSRSVIVDVRTGNIHDHTSKGGMEWTGIVAPDGSPNWIQDRAKLWNAAEAAETRKDSRVAREIELSLPHELNFEQRKALVVAFVEKEFVSRGMAADIAMHKPDKQGDLRNYHAHIMLTSRIIDASQPHGFARKKIREWNKIDMIKGWRKSWAELQNQHLREHLGHDAPRVDHRSYAERGIDKVPSRHIGGPAMEMERRGIETEMGSYNRSVAAWNARADDARRRQKEIAAQAENRRTQGFEIVRHYALMERDDQTLALSSARYRLKKITAQKEALPNLEKLNTALDRQVLADAQQALRIARRDQQTARIDFRRFKDRMKVVKAKARSLPSWITDPRRMLLLKRIETGRRTEILKDLDDRTKAIDLLQADVAARKDWLKSENGKAWRLEKTMPVLVLHREERKARWEIAQAQRERDRATRLAELAYQLKKLLPNATLVMDVSANPINRSQVFRQMDVHVEEYVRDLPPETQQKLAKAVQQSLSRQPEPSGP